MDTLQVQRMTHTSFRKKPNNKTMAWFLKRLGNLLAEGFSLKEALLFLKTLTPKEESWIQQILEGLEAGHGLNEELAKAGFSGQIVTQIYFASIHGRFAQTIYQCGISMEEKEKRKKKLWGLLSYPLLLMLFMTGLLLSMRSLLLPHLSMGLTDAAEGWERMGIVASWFVEYFPYLLTGTILCGITAVYLTNKQLEKRTAIQKAVFFSSIPIAGKLVKGFYSQLLSQEWGQLFESSLELHDIVNLMQEKQTTPFMKETGRVLEEELMKGRSFPDVLEEQSFLKSEFSRIVRHGETTGHLGKELLVYSEECVDELEERIDKMIALVQPVSFLFIALLIVSVYGAMLLPMLSNMEGIL